MTSRKVCGAENPLFTEDEAGETPLRCGLPAGHEDRGEPHQDRRTVLSETKREALRRADAHHYVVVGKGYGRDGATPNAVSSPTYRSLVQAGLLTPHSDGKPHAHPEDVRPVRGSLGFLTPDGRMALAASREGKAGR
jgi:hypothetical protein